MGLHFSVSALYFMIIRLAALKRQPSSTMPMPTGWCHAGESSGGEGGGGGSEGGGSDGGSGSIWWKSGGVKFRARLLGPGLLL